MYHPTGYFDPPLNAPELLLKHCSDQPPGTLTARHALPPGLLIVRQFLSPAQCAAALTCARETPAAPATVQDLSTDARDPRAHESVIRVTDHMPTTGIDRWLRPLLEQLFTVALPAHYGKRFAWYEAPSLLRYQPGGHYVPHADADNWHAEARTWRRAVDRDLSILLYLDEQFEGGELEFANFQFRLKPAAGMLVCFPSDHRYLHAARKVTQGERHVIVSWAAATDSPRVLESPPGDVVHLNQDTL